jgi:hypothetical protein
MKNKLFLTAILGMALGLLFAGCDNNGTEGDTWTKVTSVNEMIGIWEGEKIIPVPAQDSLPVSSPASSIGAKVTYTITSTTFTTAITMDMNKYLTDSVGAFMKDTMWQIITSGFPPEITEDGVTITMEALNGYKILMTTIAPISMLDFTGGNAQYAPYINQHKTKIKLVLPAELFQYGEGDVEFILDKK